MASKKRTYSQREKKQKEFQEQDTRRKRSKKDDELRLPGNGQTKPAMSTKKANFSGPVSIFSDEGNDEDEDVVQIIASRRSRLSVFDKARSGKLKPVKQNQRNIYGSRAEFEETMNDRSHSKENGKKLGNSHLPTPPTETAKQTTRLNRLLPVLNGQAAKLKKGASLYKSHTQRSTMSSDGSDSDPEKQPYQWKHPKQPKQSTEKKESSIHNPYEAEKTPAPEENLVGKPLSAESAEAELWSRNQSKSGFLRLPDELRNRIYDEVLGHKTINICYQTYKITHENPTAADEQKKATKVAPVFKYYCRVYEGCVDPFSERRRPTAVSTSFTLFSGVCRQLYLETATLPWELNFIAFDSYSIFVSFIFMEKRMTWYQREALLMLFLPDNLPGANMLEYLPNLYKFRLAFDQGAEQKEGVYEVVRIKKQWPRLVHC